MLEKYLKRKETLIIKAIDILDEGGMRGLTTKELAKREGITEPAVFKQFEGKQDIILTILERFSKFDEAIKNTILEHKMSPRDAVMFFTGTYAEYYQNYPEIVTVMFSFDIFKYQSETNDKMSRIIQGKYDFITELVKKGQQTGEFTRELQSEELTDIILGLIDSVIYKWKLGGAKEDLKARIMRSIQWIITRA